MPFAKTLTRAALAAVALAVAAPAAAQDTPQPDYAAVGEATAPVADAYFAAYTSRDWDAAEALLAEHADFVDPTATLVFGEVTSDGRAAIMERFRVSYAGITHMEFVSGSRMVSAETAIYEGALHWGFDLGDGTLVDAVTPMVIVLTVEDGRVVHHRDYVDYTPFIEAMRRARAEG
ncbi:nuclear transport factor 2 family protein [Aurantiacibacter sp. D1-12]|uniref:nuclear transport factor 2 family protein n=1 Tax=Aurantiacibacter sp. D1-12 TaxID=2993658 RepID=UPI00237C6CDC|nr:nuclear transport factor 2 family protein [Aurantiacibacter sp. D1-12]MDE1467682.1 nuclear transport factor 2 family protein [Aurantiacibacter sp. D1-12]